MNETQYLKILNTIYKYYGIDKDEFIKLLKNREYKFLFLLVLKNNDCLSNYELISKLGINIDRSMKNTIKKAEEKFLINTYFRKKYIELENSIKKEID